MMKIKLVLNLNSLNLNLLFTQDKNSGISKYILKGCLNEKHNLENFSDFRASHNFLLVSE